MRFVRLAFLSLVIGACDGAGKPSGPTLPESTGSDGATPSLAGDASVAPDIQRSTRSSLQWKRYATFENDLSQALDLPTDALCKEFGTEPCVRGVHLSPLGGHDPMTTGLLESPADTLVTTSTVVERVVLSACIARVQKDLASSADARVFAPLDLNGPAPAPESADTRSVITSLHRRFLARDPSDDELEVLSALARDDAGAPVTAVAFVTTACLAVGTNSEFLFF